MPPQTGKNSMFGSALKKHAADPTEVPVDFSPLPGGIVNGIARLRYAKVGTYKAGDNAGQKFLRLAAVVHEPEVVTDIKQIWKNGKIETIGTSEVNVKGQQTSVMYPLCQTKQGSGKDQKVVSIEENVQEALNMLRLLGGDDFTADIQEADDPEAAFLEKLTVLEEAKPPTRFSTQYSKLSVQYPNQRVFERWYGGKGLEDYRAETNGDVVDETGNKDVNDDAAPDKNIEVEESVEQTVEELAVIADGDDGPDKDAAIEKLQALAKERDVVTDVEKLDTWTEALPLLQDGDEAAESEEKAEEKPAVPTKGELWLYIVPGRKDPKTKKPITKPVEVEVTAVDKAKKNCTLLNNDDKKTIYKAVPFDQLTPC